MHTLYDAYFALGLFTYVVALISYLPFVSSFVRMGWRDSETRRLIFYRNCVRFWMLSIAIDVWVFFNIVPDVHDLCGAMEWEGDQTEAASYFKLSQIPSELTMQMCVIRYQFSRLNLYMLNHFQYGMLVLLSRRHFYNRVKERKQVEIKLIKKLLRNKLTPEYLPVIINSPFALELLEPNSNVTVKGVDIRKIKVIRDFVV